MQKNFTIPNTITFFRLVGIPFCAWTIITHHHSLTLWLIFLVTSSDYLDGKLARLLNQESALGTILDPIADRIFMLIIPLSCAQAQVIPWLFLGLLGLRDLSLLFMAPFLYARGYKVLPVIYLGKVATLALMSSLVLLLSGFWNNLSSICAHYLGEAGMIWGLILYYYSAIIYWWQTLTLYLHKPTINI